MLLKVCKGTPGVIINPGFQPGGYFTDFYRGFRGANIRYTSEKKNPITIDAYYLFRQLSNRLWVIGYGLSVAGCWRTKRDIIIH
jgi:hypothetical protein